MVRQPSAPASQSFSSQTMQHRFSGGLRGEETPVPIPNTEVKGPIAEGTAGRACGRVGRRRFLFPGPQTLTSLRPFLFCGLLRPRSGLKKPLPALRHRVVGRIQPGCFAAAGVCPVTKARQVVFKVKTDFTRGAITMLGNVDDRQKTVL